MPFSVRILRLLGALLLGACALGVAGITWAYLIEPNLLFVRKVDYRVPQWKGKGTPVKVVIAGDLHLMPRHLVVADVIGPFHQLLRGGHRRNLVGDARCGAVGAQSGLRSSEAEFMQ